MFKFFIGISVMALSMSACSENDIINTDSDQDNNVVDSKFKKLGTLSFDSELGEGEDENAESRTPGSVNDYGTPSQ